MLYKLLIHRYAYSYFIVWYRDRFYECAIPSSAFFSGILWHACYTTIPSKSQRSCLVKLIDAFAAEEEALVDYGNKMAFGMERIVIICGFSA